jgi:hypothetical protein
MSIITLAREVLNAHHCVEVLRATRTIRMAHIMVQGFRSVARGFWLATTFFVKALIIGLGGVWLEVTERGGTATCIIP